MGETDLISRQAAIDEVRNYYDPEDNSVVSIEDRIKALPSAQPEKVCVAEVKVDIDDIKDYIDKAINAERWISCSERLPEAQTEVIVSCTDDSGDTKFRYTSSGWVTTDKEYWIVDNEINNFVVAWREMPEPYKGEQDG